MTEVMAHIRQLQPYTGDVTANHRWLMVTNPEIRPSRELTMLVTNASHTQQQVSKGACVARASLHHSSPQETRIPAYHRSPSDAPQVPRC